MEKKERELQRKKDVQEQEAQRNARRGVQVVKLVPHLRVESLLRPADPMASAESLEVRKEVADELAADFAGPIEMIKYLDKAFSDDTFSFLLPAGVRQLLDSLIEAFPADRFYTAPAYDRVVANMKVMAVLDDLEHAISGVRVFGTERQQQALALAYHEAVTMVNVAKGAASLQKAVEGRYEELVREAGEPKWQLREHDK